MRRPPDDFTGAIDDELDRLGLFPRCPACGERDYDRHTCTPCSRPDVTDDGAARARLLAAGLTEPEADATIARVHEAAAVADTAVRIARTADLDTLSDYTATLDADEARSALLALAVTVAAVT